MLKKNNQKLIYWFHPHFYNWMGGHKYIFEVMLRLKNTYGAKVILVTAGLNSEAKTHFNKAAIPVITLSPFSTNSVIYWLFLPLFLFLEKYYLLAFKKIDREAIFVSSMFPANVLATSLSKSAAQVCYEPYAFFYDKNFIQGFSKLERIFIAFISFLYKGLDKRATQKSKILFTISKLNAEWIKNSYNLGSKVVYEGVDLDFFKNFVSAKIKKKYQNNKIIFHSTDYTQIKGTHFLIKALPRVIDKIPQLKLVISETIPNSAAKKNILDLIDKLNLKKHIEFAGFLPYKLLPEYLSVAKVVVQPSVQQSMNLTIKEAMACETPVILSPSGYEQTKNAQAGYLVNPNNTNILSKTIIKCILDEKKSLTMGKRGRKIIRGKFSWESVTKKIWKDLNKQYA